MEDEDEASTSLLNVVKRILIASKETNKENWLLTVVFCTQVNCWNTRYQVIIDGVVTWMSSLEDWKFYSTSKPEARATSTAIQCCMGG